MKIQYLNTDLDLVSAVDFTDLAAQLRARGLFALHVAVVGGSEWHGHFEIMGDADDPEHTIGAMLDAIEALDEASAAVWRQCQVREFNIGYSSGREPHSVTQHLSNALLRRIANSGATVGITIYLIDPTGER